MMRIAGDVTECRNDRRKRVPREDTNNERNHLQHLFAVDGANNRDRKREQSTDKAENGVKIHDVTARIADVDAAEGILYGAAR